MNEKPPPRAASNSSAFHWSITIVLGLLALASIGWLLWGIHENQREQAEDEQHEIPLDAEGIHRTKLTVVWSNSQSGPAQEQRIHALYPSLVPAKITANGVYYVRPPNERCVGKTLMRKVENGYEQVNDGTASFWCG